MTTFLLISLILLDLGLLGAFFFLNKRQDAQVELIAELTEERRILTELRASIQEEIEAGQNSIRTALDRVSTLATEAEQEVKSGSDALLKNVDEIASELTARFEKPLQELAKRRSYIETMMKKVDNEKEVLQTIVARGEKICKFFDKKIPYEEVLREIEDKKYTDARKMVSKGMKPGAIARDLGLSEREVKMVADLSA